MATDHTSGGGVAEEPRKKKVSPARNVVSTILLIVFATVAALEFRGNYQFNRAVTAINARLPSQADEAKPNSKLAEIPTREETEKIIGKAADGPAVSEGGFEKATYTWRGAIRKHTLTAYYQGKKKPNLVKISTE